MEKNKKLYKILKPIIFVIIIILVIIGLFYIIVWPAIKRMSNHPICNTYGENWNAVKVKNSDIKIDEKGDSYVQNGQWTCCDGVTKYDYDKCIPVD